MSEIPVIRCGRAIYSSVVITQENKLGHERIQNIHLRRFLMRPVMSKLSRIRKAVYKNLQQRKLCEADLKTKIYEVQAERFLTSFLKILTKKELVSMKKKIVKTVNDACIQKRIGFSPHCMAFEAVIKKHPVVNQDMETEQNDQKKIVIHGKTGDFLDTLKEPGFDRVKIPKVFQGCMKLRPLDDENG
jgi:hypothetical protein